LMVAARDLLQGCARWGVWARAGQGFYELGDADWVTNNAPEGPRSERFEEHRAELGCRADRLVVAYDALVRTPDSRAAGLRIASVVGMPVDQARTARAPPTGRCPIGRPGLRGGYDRAGPRARICLYEMTRGKSDPKPESMRVNQSG